MHCRAFRQDGEASMKIGFIGVGGMGYTHLLCLKEIAGTEEICVSAIADKRKERREMAEKVFPEAKLYTDGLELLEKEELDTVFIITPSYEHFPLMKKAMEKKLSIFCEKPVCLSPEDCNQLVKMEEEYEKPICIGQVVRHMPEFLFLKECIDSGKYGKLLDLSFERLSGNVNWGYEDWFHDEKKSGSVILDLHIHDLDFMRFILGEPDSAEVLHHTSFSDGMVNHIVTKAKYQDLEVLCEAAWYHADSYPFHASYRADFEKATVQFNSAIDKEHIFLCTDGKAEKKKIGGEDKEIESEMNIKSLGAYLIEDRKFIAYLLGKSTENPVSLADAVESVRLGIQILTQTKGAC